MAKKGTTNHEGVAYKARVGLVAILTLCLIAALVLYGYLVADRIMHVYDLWRTYNRHDAAFDHAMNRLYRQVGYGGFIHHYHDLLDKPEIPELEASERDLSSVFETLDRLRELGLSEDEIQALGAVRQTFTAYADALKLLRPPMVAGQPLSPEILARASRIDDTPAIRALEQLSYTGLKRSQAKELETSHSLEDIIKLLLYGTILIPLMLGIGALLITYLRRIVEANRALAAATRELDNLLETAPDAMLTVDQTRHIVRCNHQAAVLFGHRVEALKNMTVMDILPPRPTDQQERAIATFLSSGTEGRARDRRMTARRADGTLFHSEVNVSKIGKGRRTLTTLIIRDITERERNRRELKAAKEKAEEALRQFRLAQEELVRSEKMAALGGLVAGVAHEINTPVGIALSSASHLDKETRRVVEDYQKEELTAEALEEYLTSARQAAQLMLSNTQRAADLIRSFKQVAVDQTGGERRAFNLREYLDEILLSLRPRTKKMPLEITVDCPENLVMDSNPGALSQCLTNLVMNSMMHAFAPDTPGHIRIDVAQLKGDLVEIRYADDGKGIPRELHGKVFDPFFTTRRDAGGSGLGLNIVYNLAHSTLGGQLSLHSEPGKGATFVLAIPRNLPSAAPA